MVVVMLMSLLLTMSFRILRSTMQELMHVVHVVNVAIPRLLLLLVLSLMILLLQRCFALESQKAATRWYRSSAYIFTSKTCPQTAKPPLTRCGGWCTMSYLCTVKNRNMNVPQDDFDRLRLSCPGLAGDHDRLVHPCSPARESHLSVRELQTKSCTQRWDLADRPLQ